MKRFVSFFLVLAFCISGVSALAYEGTPASVSHNGILSDGTSIYGDDSINDLGEGIMPQVLIGYEYVPGHESLSNRKIDHTYKYLWGTSISFVRGASTKYTVTNQHETTETTAWNLGGHISGEFNAQIIKQIKMNLLVEGNYNSTDTAVIRRGEEWECDFSTPGLYDLTWYMRGHKYNAFCGAKYISTDGSDGNYTDYYLGDVTFPTDEVHFDISKG